MCILEIKVLKLLKFYFKRQEKEKQSKHKEGRFSNNYYTKHPRSGKQTKREN